MSDLDRQVQFRQSLMKFELYLISLWLLFVLIIVVKIDFPVCFDSNCHYIGTLKIISTNALSAISIAMVVVIAICYFRFRYRTQSNVSLPVEVKKVEDLRKL